MTENENGTKQSLEIFFEMVRKPLKQTILFSFLKRMKSYLDSAQKSWVEFLHFFGIHENKVIYFIMPVCFLRHNHKLAQKSKYGSNEIRKTQNEHLIIICQNLIGL